MHNTPSDKLFKQDKYQVFLVASRANFPFVFAIHPWFVVNRKGAVARFGVASSSKVNTQGRFGILKDQAQWGHLYKNFLPPWQGIRVFFFSWKYMWDSKLLGYIEGDEGSLAQKMADFIGRSGENYPNSRKYSLLSTNSNTYVQWVLNHFPDAHMRLPWNAFGKINLSYAAPFLLISVLWTTLWWYTAWSHIPLFSEYSFFPLWLGYILTINALSEVLVGNSLLKKMGWSLVWLFAASVPLWWFFEFLNSIVQNWHYLYRPISQSHYVLQSSIDFSTVIPAVLSTAFLFCYLFKGRKWGFKPLTITSTHPIVLVIISVASFCVMPFFPNETFPLVWIAPLLILDPLNYALGFPSILGYLKNGKWHMPITIMLAALFTGFWWEMWNFWSYPKWYYIIPYVGFWKVFEMPILGYGGYLFFGLIVWSFTVLVWGLWNKNSTKELWAWH